VSARIALIGFMLESNAFSPVADEAEFREKHWLEGEAILDDARSATPRDPGGFTGFCRAMDEPEPWQPVPLAMTTAGASGPVDQAFFDRYLAMMVHALEGGAASGRGLHPGPWGGARHGRPRSRGHAVRRGARGRRPERAGRRDPRPTRKRLAQR